MSVLPEKFYLRRGDVRHYLGLSEQAMTKVLRAGALTPVHLPGMKWAFYERGQVERLKRTTTQPTQRKETT